jgi:hypothetical protein
MDWAVNKHPAEWAAETLAPALLAAAAGWSAWKIGLPLAASAAGATITLALGVVAIRLAGDQPTAELGAFDPVGFDDVAAADELLLNDPAPADELLLDDPLVEVPQDSRVVRLFERQEPTPGELVTRISDYLGGGGRSPAPETGQEQDRQPDASAALHTALANIRASLR